MTRVAGDAAEEIAMGYESEMQATTSRDAAPNQVRAELGSGSGALDEAAGVAKATRMRERSSHSAKMALCVGKSTWAVHAPDMV